MSTLSNVDTPARLGAKARKRRISWEQYALWAVLGLGSIVMLLPFYWTMVTSFKAQRELLAFPPTWWPQEPTLQHWRRLGNLDFGSFPVFFRNSLFVTTVITLVTLLTSAMAGYMFAKIEFRGRNVLFWLVLSMMMIPFTVSIIPLYALMARLNWIDTYWSLVIPIAFNPFGIFLLRQFMFSIPNDLVDAARIDGASEFGIFFRIVLPLSKAALAALAIFTFIHHWDNFLWPFVMISERDLYTLPLGLAQFRGRVGVDIGPTAAGAMVTVLPVLAVYLAAQRQFIEGIAMTGLKG
jgi:ABC-type glycerol-3-phosphate transport system permease component